MRSSVGGRYLGSSVPPARGPTHGAWWGPLLRMTESFSKSRIRSSTLCATVSEFAETGGHGHGHAEWQSRGRA